MKILVDNFTVPIGRYSMSYGHECHMIDRNNIPIIDSFDKFRPDICILSIDNIDDTILKCIKEYPNINLYILKDIDSPNEEKIEYINNSIGCIYTTIHYDIAIWDSVIYPHTNTEKENLEVYFDGYVPAVIKDKKIRIFNNAVIDSEFYCGSIEENQKYFIFKSAKYVSTLQKDWYNAIACGCKINGLSEDINEKLKKMYSENNSAVFYNMIMENEK